MALSGVTLEGTVLFGKRDLKSEREVMHGNSPFLGLKMEGGIW